MCDERHLEPALYYLDAEVGVSQGELEPQNGAQLHCIAPCINMHTLTFTLRFRGQTSHLPPRFGVELGKMSHAKNAMIGLPTSG